MFLAIVAAAREVAETAITPERVLIGATGIIIGLVSVIFGMLNKRINAIENIAPEIYAIKAGVEFIKRNCPRCNLKD